MSSRCDFCELLPIRIFQASDYWLTVPDAYPVSPGHTLIIPKRHIVSFFELNHAEYADLWTILHTVKATLDTSHQPDAYNIGVNDGPAAGQTVPHLHLHLIPRFEGDTKDPRGGIRWMFPEKADYWSRTR